MCKGPGVWLILTCNHPLHERGSESQQPIFCMTVTSRTSWWETLMLLSRVKKEKARLQHLVCDSFPEQVFLGLHPPGHYEQPVPLRHPLTSSSQAMRPRWFTAAAHPRQIRKKNLYNYTSWLLVKYLPALNTKRLCKWSRDSYCSKLIFFVQYYANCINFILLLLLQAVYPKALIR